MVWEKEKEKEKSVIWIYLILLFLYMYIRYTKYEKLLESHKGLFIHE